MLQIVVDGIPLDLYPDTEIEYRIDNPLFETDRITVPYSQSFDVPQTETNLRVFGYPNRITSKNSHLSKHRATVLFSAITIVDGELYISEINANGISVQLSGVMLPPSMKKKLYEYDFGKDVFRLDGERYKTEMNSLFTQRAESPRPDIVAATMSIKGSSATVYEYGEGRYENQRSCLLNPYRDGCSDINYSYMGYYTNSAVGIEDRVGAQIKLMPAFRVGFILQKILPQLSGSIFDYELSRLMILSNYHPKYRMDDNSLLLDVDIPSIDAFIKYADFMPDITVKDFICELSKLMCMTLFLKGDAMMWELNNDLVNSTYAVKYRITDDYSFSFENGQKYNFEMLDDNNEKIQLGEQSIIEVDTINEMLNNADKTTERLMSDESVQLYKVKSTNQIFEVFPDSNLSQQFLMNIMTRGIRPYWKTQLREQSTVQQKTEINAQDDERDSFDVSFKGHICKTILTEYLADDEYYRPRFDDQDRSFQERIYVPEVKINMTDGKPVRGSELTIGQYNGMHAGPPMASTLGYPPIAIPQRPNTTITYPQISHSGHLPDGTKVSNLELSAAYLVENFHNKFKDWIESDRKVVKGSMLLSATELANLDIRHKVHFKGCNFFIRSISIMITPTKILPAEVELIES